MINPDPSQTAVMPSTEQTGSQPGSSGAGHSPRFSFSSAAWFVLGMIALTFLEFRAVALIQGQHVTDQVRAAQGVLSGHPPWRLYQSRLLGPLLAGGLAHITHRPFALAYNVVARSLLLLANALCYGLFLRLGGNRRLAWGYTLAYAGLFVVLQDTRWLYLWDYVDLVTLLCFAFLVFTRTNLVFLSVLFLLELLNREAATFIGLWIMMEAIHIPIEGAVKRIKINPVPLLVGGGLIGMGVVWTHWIRNRLCIAPQWTAPVLPLVGDQLWQVQSNITSLHHPFSSGAVVFLIVVGALAALLVLPSTLPAEKKVKIGVLTSLMLVSIWLFAEIKEVRVSFEFVPFGLLLFYSFSKRHSTSDS